ncbi:hypothetical protein RCO48_09340 [Peribacillus frigoritolerans]|nr:hypothetical protein [Peribacillus frigoritolerans]
MIASLMKSWTIWIKIGVILFGVFLLSWLGPDEIGLTDLLISLREGEETGNQLMLAVFFASVFKYSFSFVSLYWCTAVGGRNRCSFKPSMVKNHHSSYCHSTRLYRDKCLLFF